MYMETPVNVTDKIVLDGLQPDVDYNFMVSILIIFNCQLFQIPNITLLKQN